MLRSSALLVAVAVGLSACAPTCDTVCRKLRRCDVAARLSQDECVESCDRQEGLYQLWEDEEKLRAFRDHKRCLRSATCEEILDDVCYDDEIYIY